jgi:hypothetical protein
MVSMMSKREDVSWQTAAAIVIIVAVAFALAMILTGPV